MCEECALSPSARGKKRASLSDIDPARHCAIIGAGLSSSEMKSVANKFSDYVRPQATDYEIHVAIVHMAARDKKLAKVLTRILDRKYAVVLARLSRLENDEQLLAAWSDLVSKGEVAAGLWTILSHPKASEALCARIYGEAHMMAHRIDRALRAEVRKTDGLARMNEDLRRELEKLHSRCTDSLSARDAELQELRRLWEAESLRANRLARQASLASEAEELRSALFEAKNKAERSEESYHRSLCAHEAERRDLEKQNRMLREENARLKEDAQKMEEHLAALLTPSDKPSVCDGASLDLCGRCILFVGGRNQHVPHLRRIVERCNGAFAHHDGGLEESLGLLPGLVGRADAVLFAVDNISHAAQDELKRHCRRQDRVFVPVRRSGISAYLSALRTLAEDRA
ncbi:hypothetical protein FACS1894205_0650 [Alphaproteobacteria bacterium]|nr:hypothetical protein FACS1894205_0650 [Alphaproteobacteria bacterium]